jgi:hypothetical protein
MATNVTTITSIPALFNDTEERHAILTTRQCEIVFHLALALTGWVAYLWGAQVAIIGLMGLIVTSVYWLAQFGRSVTAPVHIT